MTKTLLNNINNIPPLPETVNEVNRIYQDENSTIEDLQKAIEKDPFLTTDILRIINSPMYGMKNKVSTIRQAISLLGKDAIRTFVMSTTVSLFELNLSPYSMSKEEFTLASEKQLAIMINWLIRRNPKRLSTLGPAAFLVDLGRVIIAKSLIEDDNADALKEALQAGETISQAEKSACGAQTTDITATLFHKWNLDPEMIHVIRYSDDPEGTSGEEREMAAQLKAVRESVMPNGEITLESIQSATETIEEFGLDLERYKLAITKVLEEE